MVPCSTVSVEKAPLFPTETLTAKEEDGDRSE